MIEVSPQRRTKSAPDSFHYPTNPIPIKLCGSDAVCPITQQEFRIGDAVYVLKSDISNIRKGKSVVCISAPGLKNLASRSKELKLQDPLKRESGRLLSLEDDYVKYVLSDAEPSSF